MSTQSRRKEQIEKIKRSICAASLNGEKLSKQYLQSYYTYHEGIAFRTVAEYIKSLVILEEIMEEAGFVWSPYHMQKFLEKKQNEI